MNRHKLAGEIGGKVMSVMEKVTKLATTLGWIVGITSILAMMSVIGILVDDIGVDQSVQIIKDEVIEQVNNAVLMETTMTRLVLGNKTALLVTFGNNVPIIRQNGVSIPYVSLSIDGKHYEGEICWDTKQILYKSIPNGKQVVLIVNGKMHNVAFSEIPTLTL